MEEKHKKELRLGNHMRNLVGQPFYRKKPSNKKILENLLTGMAKFSGTCWNPVATVDENTHRTTSTSLMLKQCPGACGHVWKIDIVDNDVSNWLVNEINQRRHG